MGERGNARPVEQRLEIRENLGPATGDALEHLRVALEVVMRNRKTNEPIAMRLDVD